MMPIRRSAERTVIHLLVFTVWTACTIVANAEIQTQTVSYRDGEVECQGFMAWDDAVEGKRPGVLVVHEWWGLNDYARERVKQLAALGYVAFAADMYGRGQVTDHPEEAGAMASKIRENINVWRQRGLAALEVLAKDPHCDPSNMAAIGYCFGGTTALQLAYAGADLDAVVTFHGALVVPTADEAAKIKGTILICHGAQDNFIPEGTIQEFRAALDQGAVDWSMQYYGGAKHSFTVATANDRGVPGLAYDPKADSRSWRAMRDLLQERFVVTK